MDHIGIDVHKRESQICILTPLRHPRPHAVSPRPHTLEPLEL
jgi:hypothetical protein